MNNSCAILLLLSTYLIFFAKGHAIECGWYLLREASIQGSSDLAEFAIKHFIVNPFDYGWDGDYGGLFYFLDVDGQ